MNLEGLHHIVEFKATLKDDGKGYAIEIVQELCGPVTIRELIVLHENLTQAFNAELEKCMRSSIEEAIDKLI